MHSLGVTPSLSSLSHRSGSTGVADEIHGMRVEGGATETIRARRISQVGSSCRVRFIQDECFCPMFIVGTSPAAYVLMKQDAFSIRLDNDNPVPVVAKLEIDGKLYNSEYRILPNGTRSIKEVRERFIATTRALVYRFPNVYDNLLRREVEADEMELCTMDDVDEFTSLCRVLFLSVRGGVAATRKGCWEIDRSVEPLAVEMVRVGHQVPLARLFGINLLELGKSLPRASLGPQRHRAASFSHASPFARTGSTNSSRRNWCDSEMGRARSASTMRTSRSGSMERRGLLPQSSLTCFLRSTSGVPSGASSTLGPMVRGKPPSVFTTTCTAGSAYGRMSPEEEASMAPSSKLVKETSPSFHTLLPHAPFSVLAEGARTTKSLLPTSQRGGSPIPRLPPHTDGSRSVSTGTRGEEARAGSPGTKANGERSASGGSARNAKAYRICVRCNAAFDRERHKYNEMITSLQERVMLLEQEKMQLMAINARMCVTKAGPIKRQDTLEGTLTPRRRKRCQTGRDDTDTDTGSTPSTSVTYTTAQSGDCNEGNCSNNHRTTACGEKSVV